MFFSNLFILGANFFFWWKTQQQKQLVFTWVFFLSFTVKKSVRERGGIHNRILIDLIFFSHLNRWKNLMITKKKKLYWFFQWTYTMKKKMTVDYLYTFIRIVFTWLDSGCSSSKSNLSFHGFFFTISPSMQWIYYHHHHHYHILMSLNCFIIIIIILYCILKMTKKHQKNINNHQGVILIAQLWILFTCVVCVCVYVFFCHFTSSIFVFFFLIRSICSFKYIFQCG